MAETFLLPGRVREHPLRAASEIHHRPRQGRDVQPRHHSAAKRPLRKYGYFIQKLQVQ